MIKWKYGYAKNDQLANDLRRDWNNRIGSDLDLLVQVDEEYAEKYFNRYPFIHKEFEQYWDDRLHILSERIELENRLRGE